jgi:hypothetical protein
VVDFIGDQVRGSEIGAGIRDYGSGADFDPPIPDPRSLTPYKIRAASRA